MDKFELKLKINDLERIFYKQVGKTDLLFNLVTYKINREDNAWLLLNNIYKEESNRQQEIYVQLMDTYKLYNELDKKKGK